MGSDARRSRSVIPVLDESIWRGAPPPPVTVIPSLPVSAGDMVDPDTACARQPDGRHVMPWQERSLISARREFVTVASEEGVTASALTCRCGSSRTTAYIWLERYARDGSSSRAVRRPRHVTPAQRSRSRSSCCVLRTHAGVGARCTTAPSPRALTRSRRRARSRPSCTGMAGSTPWRWCGTPLPALRALRPERPVAAGLHEASAAPGGPGASALDDIDTGGCDTDHRITR